LPNVKIFFWTFVWNVDGINGYIRLVGSYHEPITLGAEHFSVAYVCKCMSRRHHRKGAVHGIVSQM
jgi:hypothetical protein